jgi:hypothetical protein
MNAGPATSPRGLDSEPVWATEDVRNLSGSLERFLIDRGKTVCGSHRD